MSGEKSKPLNIQSNIYCYYFFSKKNKVVREKQREKKKGLNPFSLKKIFLFTKMVKNGGGCVRLINSAVRKGKGICCRGEWVNGAGGIVVVVK